MPWEGSYIGNILRRELFSINAAEIRPYFEYHKVRDGIFQLTNDLFGYSIRPVEANVWHDSVQAYEMWEGDRKLGSFYLDMHPRENKFSHAGMFQMDVGQKGRHLPSAALVTNLPGESGKGYLELRDVETFLHEFGHLVHWLTMNHQRWVRNTDPEWDFIEAPSQMLENWLYDPETVQRFATNDAGEPIPAETILKIREAEDFGQGMFIFGQMELADLSLSLHDRDPASFEIQGLVDKLDDRYRLFGDAEGVHEYAAFGHLANPPYAASYYLYMWSLVIADDMFSRFQKEGLRNRAVSFDYRDEVLASGGSRPAADSVEVFLGRPFDFEAFRQRLAESR
jgi:thimet oligopeptidase